MFTEVVTLVTLAVFWGRFEFDFLATDGPDSTQNERRFTEFGGSQWMSDLMEKALLRDLRRGASYASLVAHVQSQSPRKLDVAHDERCIFKSEDEE